MRGEREGLKSEVSGLLIYVFWLGEGGGGGGKRNLPLKFLYFVL